MTAPADSKTTPTGKDTPRQAVARFAFTVLFGPLIGTLGVIAALMLPAMFSDPPSLRQLAEILIFGWMIGVIPAALAALIMVPLTPYRQGLGLTIVLTLLAGALASLAGIVVYTTLTQSPSLLVTLLALAIPAGAVSLTLSTLVFDRFVWRRASAA